MRLDQEADSPCPPLRSSIVLPAAKWQTAPRVATVFLYTAIPKIAETINYWHALQADQIRARPAPRHGGVKAVGATACQTAYIPA
jgi:hypothetical protein